MNIIASSDSEIVSLYQILHHHEQLLGQKLEAIHVQQQAIWDHVNSLSNASPSISASLPLNMQPSVQTAAALAQPAIRETHAPDPEPSKTSPLFLHHGSGLYSCLVLCFSFHLMLCFVLLSV